MTVAPVSSAAPSTTPCWVDLTTADRASAGNFFTHLFGWQIRVDESMDYTLVSADGNPPTLGIGDATTSNQHPAGVVAYFPVDDLHTALDTARHLGANIVVEPWTVPGLGEMAIITDPSGSRIGLMTPHRTIASEPAEEPPADQLHGTARIHIHDGQLERFLELARRCMNIVRTRDSGTLEYRIHVNSAGTQAFVHERYRDSAAGLEHMDNIADVLQPLSQVCTIEGEVCGNPSPELREALQRTGVAVYSPLA